LLELVEDVLDVVDAGAGGEPFGGADCAFGEGSAGGGLVREGDAVAGADGFEGVDAGNVAGAVGVDEDFAVGADGAEDGVAEGERGAAGGVELALVVGLGDGEGVASVFERGGHLFGELEHDLHADGVVGAVEERGSAALGEGAHVVELVVPAGGADDHLCADGEAGAHVLHDGFGSGEVDDDVEAGDEGRGEGSGVFVFFGVEDVDAVAAFGGYFCYEFAGLADA